MATEHNPSGRRPHYHRGRRGTDRRGNDRRTPPQGPDQGGRASSEQVDVEQIMREIRARISQRHGIELSPQQIQDLAARKLEAILDPRTVNPTLIDQLRKGAAAAPDPLPSSPETEYSFSDNAIYESANGLLRFFRRLLNPLLKLFFNPAPVITALQAQSRINRDAAARVADAERRQTEWNALHYQILQRLVTEISRVSIEMAALNGRIESLAARVDFNDRRVRSFETASANRNQRAPEIVPVPAPTETSIASNEGVSTTPAGAQPSSDAPRRRRRRRRGRRGSVQGTDSAAGVLPAVVAQPPDDTDVDDGEEEPAIESAGNDAGPVEEESSPSFPADAALQNESPPMPPSPPASAPVPPPQPATFSFMPQPAATPDEVPAEAPTKPADPGPSDR